MLTSASRHDYRTILDAQTLKANDEFPALVYLSLENEPQTVTRREFIHSVTAYAGALQAMGITQNDLVMIAHTQNLESIFAFWGALLIGTIPSMFPTLTEKLDPDVYMANLTELVQFSDVRAVLTTDDFSTLLSERVSCPVYGSEALLKSVGSSMTVTPHAPEPDAVAFLQHSSGTTGLQKGVALTHRAVLNQLASYSDAIGLNQDDVIVSWLPLYHDMGLIAGFLLPLMQGVQLVLMSPFEWVKSPALLFRAIDQYRGTLCWLPNFAYNHCARRIRQHDLEGISAASMRMFINCSEPVYHESHTLFANRFAQIGVKPSMLAVSYAMAENTFAITQTPLGSEPQLDVVDRSQLQNQLYAQPVAANHPQAIINVSCGKPINGVSVRTMDASGKTLPERAVGELAVQSDSMLTGYYKRPDLQPFQDGWYFTGDRGYIADGEIYVVGRSKDLIINAGKNVYPQDIEFIANTIDGIRAGRVVAFGVFDQREGTELIAIVAEVETDDRERQEAIAKNLRQKIAQSTTVTVTYIHLVDSKWLIKTSSGKLARAANRDKWVAEKNLASKNQ